MQSVTRVIIFLIHVSQLVYNPVFEDLYICKAWINIIFACLLG